MNELTISEACLVTKRIVSESQTPGKITPALFITTGSIMSTSRQNWRRVAVFKLWGAGGVLPPLSILTAPLPTIIIRLQEGS